MKDFYNRIKMMGESLIATGMMDEKVRDLLVNYGRNGYGKGMVFYGPPGGGKTTLLNWFLEDAYEPIVLEDGKIISSMVVAQEHEELWAVRPGVTFINTRFDGKYPERLLLLSELAGKNVFIADEPKRNGAAMIIAMLSNAGCRTAITMHAATASDAFKNLTSWITDGADDLVGKFNAITYEQSLQKASTFKTFVCVKDFQVTRIDEVIGYDEEKKAVLLKNVFQEEEK